MNKCWNWVKNEETAETELVFNGPISEESWLGDEITPGIFRDELSKHPGNLTVWLTSPGGDVFAASQIYAMLKNHNGKITVKIDGIAASAASVVAMAGDETLISPTAMLMVHDPATIAMGNKADMEKAITLLDEVKESIINAYETKSHLSRSRIAKMMSDETWMNAKKAMQLGFVDGILFSDNQKNDKTDDNSDEKNQKTDTSDEEKYTAMQYYPSTITASLLKKISAETPLGIPIDQLEKRLALLKK